jgi:hypothetical protein
MHRLKANDMTEELNTKNNLSEVIADAELIWETPTLARMDVTDVQFGTGIHNTPDATATS